jgi:hypothetical protein
MKFALGLAIFVVFAGLAIAGKWYALKDSLSMFTRTAAPGDRHRFSLSTLLVVYFALALGFGMFVVMLRRG